MSDRARRRISTDPTTTSGTAAASRCQEAPPNPPEQEIEDLAQRRPGEVHRHRQAGRQQRADRVPGQQEARHRRRAAEARETVDDGDRHERADEREPVEQAELQHDDVDGDDDGDRRAEGRARRRPEHVRVGERVAQEPLERHSGDREAHPDEHAREDARKPQVHHDRLGRRRPGGVDIDAEEAMGEDPERVSGRDRHGPEADPEDERAAEGNEADGGETQRCPRTPPNRPIPVRAVVRASGVVAMLRGRWTAPGRRGPTACWRRPPPTAPAGGSPPGGSRR